MRLRSVFLPLAVLMLAIALAPFLPPAGKAAASTVPVTVSPGGSISYSPNSQMVNVGDTIHWVWSGSGHSTTSGSCSGFTCTPDGKWDSGVQSVPNSFDFTFTSAGTYAYYCRVHGSSMTGTIVVQDASAPTPTPVAQDFIPLGLRNFAASW